MAALPPYDAVMFAVLGLRGWRPARGLRVVFMPTFHRWFCVAVDLDACTLELHGLPQGRSVLDFVRGPDGAPVPVDALTPVAHPCDIVELEPEAWAPVAAALDRIAPAHRHADWGLRGQWRDGMCGQVEVFDGATSQRFGEAYPVGEGPPGHLEFCRAVLDLVEQNVPSWVAWVAGARRYTAPSEPPLRRAASSRRRG